MNSVAESGPRCVAIISDGSARWASRRRLSLEQGHQAAAQTALERVEDAVELGIEQLTLFAFSTENWSRPAEEVETLLAMLAERVSAHTEQLGKLGVRVGFVGRRDRAGHALADAITSAERQTEANVGMRLWVALDYGGRDEIVRAAARYRGRGDDEFRSLLLAPEMRDPDLVIRTSGEMRLSNFLLWQCAYSELVFRDELWPAFGRDAFEEALVEYQARQRRLGGRAHAAAVVHCGGVGPE